MQLDIFDHSRDVMLRNDVLQVLEQHDAARSRGAWVTLHQEYAKDESLPALLALTEAVEARARQALHREVFADHPALRRARLALQDATGPAALSLMGQKDAALWLRPFWQDLVQRCAHLPFHADSEQDHAAPMLLHIGDWQGAAGVVARIESWRRIPAPLAWMTQAKLHLYGLQATWGLLAELAWLSPNRLDALVQGAPDPTLPRLKGQFEAEFEATADPTDAAHELAWFPAWVLTERPQLVASLAQAQTSLHSAPEQAMRLLVNLLGLERQGRHHDIVSLRKSLRDLNPWLYGAYMRTR